MILGVTLGVDFFLLIEKINIHNNYKYTLKENIIDIILAISGVIAGLAIIILLIIL
jgi:hypothetical protein